MPIRPGGRPFPPHPLRPRAGPAPSSPRPQPRFTFVTSHPSLRTWQSNTIFGRRYLPLAARALARCPPNPPPCPPSPCARGTFARCAVCFPSSHDAPQPTPPFTHRHVPVMCPSLRIGHAAHCTLHLSHTTQPTPTPSQPHCTHRQLPPLPAHGAPQYGVHDGLRRTAGAAVACSRGSNHLRAHEREQVETLTSKKERSSGRKGCRYACAQHVPSREERTIVAAGRDAHVHMRAAEPHVKTRRPSAAPLSGAARCLLQRPGGRQQGKAAVHIAARGT